MNNNNTNNGAVVGGVPPVAAAAAAREIEFNAGLGVGAGASTMALPPALSNPYYSPTPPPTRTSDGSMGLQQLQQVFGHDYANSAIGSNTLNNSGHSVGIMTMMPNQQQQQQQQHSRYQNNNAMGPGYASAEGLQSMYQQQQQQHQSPIQHQQYLQYSPGTAGGMHQHQLQRQPQQQQQQQQQLQPMLQPLNLAAQRSAGGRAGYYNNGHASTVYNPHQPFCGGIGEVGNSSDPYSPTPFRDVFHNTNLSQPPTSQHHHQQQAPSFDRTNVLPRQNSDSSAPSTAAQSHAPNYYMKPAPLLAMSSNATVTTTVTTSGAIKPPPLTSGGSGGIRIAPFAMAGGGGTAGMAGGGHNDDQTEEGGMSRQREQRYDHPVIEELFQIISDGDYIRFLNLLEERGTEAEIAREGFQLFSKHVVDDQVAKPSAVIVPGGEWAKTLKRNMERFPRDSTVVLNGLLCMVTLSELHEKYMRAMVKKGALDIVILVLANNNPNQNVNNNHNSINDGGGNGDDAQAQIRILELVTSFVYFLSAHDKDGLNVKTNHVVTIIRKMAAILTNPPPPADGELRMAPARAFAVLALWNLANQKRRSESTGKSLMFDVQNVLVGPDVIPALVEVFCTAVASMGCGGGKDDDGGGGVVDEDEDVRDNSLAAPSIQAAAGLLQICLFPDLVHNDGTATPTTTTESGNASIGTSENSADDMSSSPQILHELMVALVAAIQPRQPLKLNSVASLQACCSLIGNMALPRPNTTHFPGAGWRTRAVHALAQMLASCRQYQDNPNNPDSTGEGLESLAVWGIHAMCNWLAKKQQVGGAGGARSSINGLAVVEDGRLVVNVILDSLKQYSKNAELQELGCLALAYACRPGPDGGFCAEFAVEQLAMDRIFFALEHPGAYLDSEEKRNNPPALHVRRSALSAMIALTQCSAGVRNLVDTERLSQVEFFANVEQESDVQELLQSILKRCGDGGEEDHSLNNYSASLGPFLGGAGGGRLRQHPEAFAQMISIADSEENALSVIHDLESWMADKGIPDSGKLVPFVADRGMDALVEVMGRFDASAAVQESGCGVLAELFCLAPYHIGTTTGDQHGPSWTLIQAQPVIDTLRNAMQRHKAHSGVQTLVCLALSNFLGPLCDETPRRNSITREESDDLEVVRGLVDPCLKDVLNTMVMNEEHPNVQMSAIQLFWTLSFVCHRDNLKLRMFQVVQQIFKAMNQFPLNVELNVTACSALLSFQNDSDALDFCGSQDGVKSLLAIVLDGKGGEQVVAGAAAVLASTLKNVFSAIGHIAQSPGYVQRLIECVQANAASPEIQLYICSILESLATLDDDGVPYMIFEAGGLDVIRDTLSLHKHDQLLAEYGCRILSLVLGTADANTISANRHRLRDSLIQLMEIHFDDPHVQTKVMESLWTCCRQDGDFINLLVYETQRCVDLIVRSMSKHLMWPDLQRNGCSLIRLMSSCNHRDLALQSILGEKGVVAAVVNGMSAHSDSSAVQKEALRTLRCLAMISSNKPLIFSVDGTKALMNALWIHMRDPQLVSGAFSALHNIIVTGNRAGPLSDDAMQAIIFAMRRYTMDESVQKQACFLLKSASYLSSNQKLMRQYENREIIELLKFAAEAFPNSCQLRANSILNKISG
jgi:hypothetical protein